MACLPGAARPALRVRFLMEMSTLPGKGLPVPHRVVMEALTAGAAPGPRTQTPRGPRCECVVPSPLLPAWHWAWCPRLPFCHPAALPGRCHRQPVSKHTPVPELGLALGWELGLGHVTVGRGAGAEWPWEAWPGAREPGKPLPTPEAGSAPEQEAREEGVVCADPARTPSRHGQHHAEYMCPCWSRHWGAIPAKVPARRARFWQRDRQ